MYQQPTIVDIQFWSKPSATSNERSITRPIGCAPEKVQTQPLNLLLVRLGAHEKSFEYGPEIGAGFKRGIRGHDYSFFLKAVWCALGDEFINLFLSD